MIDQTLTEIRGDPGAMRPKKKLDPYLNFNEAHIWSN
jgi:hypothetical protein